jgi:hypothetical protein
MALAAVGALVVLGLLAGGGLCAMSTAIARVVDDSRRSERVVEVPSMATAPEVLARWVRSQPLECLDVRGDALGAVAVVKVGSMVDGARVIGDARVRL